MSSMDIKPQGQPFQNFRLPDYKLLKQPSVTPNEGCNSLKATPRQQISQSFIQQDYFGKIGWGMGNSDLNVSPQRVVLENQPHKTCFDKERSNNFTKVNGYFSSHIDKKLGIDLETFQTMDIRSLRILIKQKVWQQQMKMKNLYLNNNSNSRAINGQHTLFDDKMRLGNSSINYSNNISTNAGVSNQRMSPHQDKSDIASSDAASPFALEKSFDRNNRSIPIREAREEHEQDPIMIKARHERQTSYDANISTGTMIKSKCHKMQKLMNAQASRIQSIKDQKNRKREYYRKSEHKRGMSLDYNDQISYSSKSPILHGANSMLPKLGRIGPNTNQRVYYNGDPSVNFQAQKLLHMYNNQPEVSMQQYQQTEIPPYKQDQFPRILAGSSNNNDQSQATNLTFLNNSTTQDNLEYSKTSNAHEQFMEDERSQIEIQ